MISYVAPERLETPEFTVRCYQHGDGGLLSEAVNSSYAHLWPWMPWATAQQTVEESEANARFFMGQYLTNADFRLGIFTPQEDRLLGSTGFHLRHESWDAANAEIGMWIRADAAGKGLGVRVLRAMLQWGFTAWRWQRIAWHCDATNIPSARTAEKAGMRREGCLLSDALTHHGTRRDTLIYGLLRSEWAAREATG